MKLKHTIGLFAFAVLILSLLSAKPITSTYLYVDGNNNDYTITENNLIYTPVIPTESSSGEYSGGEAKSVKITEEQFLKIERIIKAILKDKSNFEETRVMGCGTLIIGKKATYFKSNSLLKVELMACLN